MRKYIILIILGIMATSGAFANPPQTKITPVENPAYDTTAGVTEINCMKRIKSGNKYFEISYAVIPHDWVIEYYNFYFRVYEYDGGKFTYLWDKECILPEKDYAVNILPESSIKQNNIGGFDFWGITSKYVLHPKPQYFSFDASCNLVDEHLDSLSEYNAKFYYIMPSVITNENELITVDLNNDQGPLDKQIVFRKFDKKANFISEQGVFDCKPENFPTIENATAIVRFEMSSYLRKSSNDDFYLCGNLLYHADDSTGTNYMHTRYAIFKFNSNFEFQWLKMSFDLFDNDFMVVNDMQIDNNDDIILYGYLSDPDDTYPVTVSQVLKLSGENGEVIAKSEVFGAEVEMLLPRSICVTSKNEFLLNGENWHKVKGKSGYFYKHYLVKLDSNLNVSWKLVDTSTDTTKKWFLGEFTEIEPDHYFISGYDTGTEEYKDKRIFLEIFDGANQGIKFSDDSGVFVKQSESQLILEYTSEKISDIIISVADITGRIVYSKQHNFTNNLIETIDTDGFARGAYLINLSDGKQVFTHKVIIQ